MEKQRKFLVRRQGQRNKNATPKMPQHACSNQCLIAQEQHLAPNEVIQDNQVIKDGSLPIINQE